MVLYMCSIVGVKVGVGNQWYGDASHDGVYVKEGI